MAMRVGHGIGVPKSATGHEQAACTQLASLTLPGVGCYHFDDIGVPSAEEIEARFATGQSWQV